MCTRIPRSYYFPFITTWQPDRPSPQVFRRIRATPFRWPERAFSFPKSRLSFQPPPNSRYVGRHILPGYNKNRFHRDVFPDVPVPAEPNEEKPHALRKNPVRPDPVLRIEQRPPPCGMVERFARHPRTPKDRLQDFDIVYAVTDIRPFIADTGWIARFGKPLMILEPDSLPP